MDHFKLRLLDHVDFRLAGVAALDVIASVLSSVMSGDLPQSNTTTIPAAIMMHGHMYIAPALANLDLDSLPCPFDSTISSPAPLLYIACNLPCEDSNPLQSHFDTTRASLQKLHLARWRLLSQATSSTPTPMSLILRARYGPRRIGLRFES